MSTKAAIQNAIKEAMKSRDTLRLECLRMAKAALLLKEKASSDDLKEEDAIAAVRAEVKKRRQSIDIFREHGKEDEAATAEAEIAVLEEFLPKQLSPEELEEKVKAYIAEHPDLTHAGKLTGALKKELGDTADGKTLNEICRRLLTREDASE